MDVMKKPLLVALSLVLGLSALGPPAGATFPGRNGKIAFSTGRQIFTVRADGTKVRKITDTRSANRSPAWSPDGGHLAFSCRGNARSNKDICIMRADGSLRRTLTSDEIGDQTPAWSPDGKILAISRDTGTGSQIFLIARDGGNLMQLTHNPVSAFAPEWSPDGERILFTAWGLGSLDIFSIHVDGTDEINLTQSPEPEARAGWSPDGDRIVFDRLIEGEGYQLFVAAADGTEKTPLNVHASTPTWSPNGARIVATTLRGNYLRCLTVRGDGSDVRLVSPRGMDCYSPDWQPLGAVESLGAANHIR